MPDVRGTRSSKNLVGSNDYKSSDPAPVTLNRGAATSLDVTVNPTALSGAGCTVTVTTKDADTNAQLNQFTVTAQSPKTVNVPVPTTTHRVTVTAVGSGTRTTLTYSIDCVWRDVTYAPGVIWDGSKYDNNVEAQTP